MESNRFFVEQRRRMPFLVPRRGGQQRREKVIFFTANALREGGREKERPKRKKRRDCPSIFSPSSGHTKTRFFPFSFLVGGAEPRSSRCHHWREKIGGGEDLWWGMLVCESWGRENVVAGPLCLRLFRPPLERYLVLISRPEAGFYLSAY